jgi:2-haloacid dehalogenase
MIDAARYVVYDGLVERAAADVGLPPDAPAALHEAWAVMRPWPDTVALEGLGIGYAFVTNCSSELAAVAVERSGLRPMFTLSAEEAGWFKPRREVYALAAERLGLAATQVQFVAGAAYDAIGASKAGLSTVLVARRPTRERLPKQIRVVESLGQALEGMERGST